MSEYLLADAQPAMRMPMTDSDETARAKKMPTSRSSTTRCWLAGSTTYSSSVLISTTIGAVLNTKRSALSGMRSSFWTNLAPSASSWSRPRGPASWGPLRLCIHDMTLNRKTMPRISAVVGTRMATTISLMRVDCQ